MTRTLIHAIVTLALAGCGAELAWYGHTRDRTQRIEVHADGDEQWVTLGSRHSRRFHAIALGSVTSAATGSKLAFVAMRRNDDGRERWYVVVDFVESAAWDGIGTVLFDRRGQRVAYLAERDHGWRAVVDGREHTTFRDIDVRSLQFSPDGSRVGYIAFDGTCARVVIDEEPGACHVALQSLALGSDVAHDVLVTSEGGARAQVRVGENAESQPYDEVRDVVLAPDGMAVAYTARDGHDWFVVSAGTPGPRFQAIEAPVYSADAQHLGYLGRNAQGTQVIVDGLARQTVAAATALSVSPDGRRVAFVTHATRGLNLVVDDRPFHFDVVIEGSLRWSRDGRHWAALVGALAERALWIVVDGGQRLPFDSEELFGGGLGDRDTLQALGDWVTAELERHLQQDDG